MIRLARDLYFTLVLIISSLPTIGLVLHWLNYDSEGDIVLNLFFNIVFSAANWSI